MENTALFQLNVKFTTPRNLSPQRQLVAPIHNLYFIPYPIKFRQGVVMIIVFNIHTVQCYIHSVIDSPTLSLAVSWTTDVSRAARSHRAGDSVHGQSHLCVRTTNNNSHHQGTKSQYCSNIRSRPSSPSDSVTAAVQSPASANAVPWLAQYPTMNVLWLLGRNSHLNVNENVQILSNIHV